MQDYEMRYIKDYNIFNIKLQLYSVKQNEINN